MIIIVVGAVVLAVAGGIFLAYLGRHPKCPNCGNRVNFVIPLLLKRCKSSYKCNNCYRDIPAARYRPRQGGQGK